MQIADKGCRQVSLTRDSRHGFKFPSLIPATLTTLGVCIVKSKINLNTWAGGGLLFMGEYIEKSIVDDTAELLTERGLTP